MKRLISILLKTILFAVLTMSTQIGGIVYLVSLSLNNKLKKTSKLKSILIFSGAYLFCTIIIVPLIAPIFGREKVVHNNKIQPTNYLTVLLNRNYVRPNLNQLLLQTAKHLKNTPIEIHYLDANFPFINTFPLLPHLSHNDGKKIDISFIYKTGNNKISNKQKSMSGYGVFESPKRHESNQIEKCFQKGHFQYDYPKYVTFGSINNDLYFSKIGTKILIKSILKNPLLGKIFIEPHLKHRLNLNDKRIRYQGCRAVRHDDHLHIQLK